MQPGIPLSTNSTPEGLQPVTTHPASSRHQLWITAVLVVVVWALYLAGNLAQRDLVISIPGFVWILLLFIPVVFSGVVTGLAGALATAGFGIVLIVPAELVLPQTDTQRWGAWSAIVMIVVVAIVTGIVSSRHRSTTGLEANTTIEDGDEQRFQLAFQDSPVAMAVVNLEGSLMRVNRSLCELLGRSEDELVGSDILAITHPDDQEIGSHENALLTTGQRTRVRYTKRLLAADDKAIEVEIARSITRNEAGVPRYVIASIRDLTADSEAARAIAESELRFRLAFENNLAGMVLHDHEGRFLEANDAFCQIVGYSLEELTASGSSLFIDPDDAELAAADRQQVFSQNPTPTQRVRRYRHKSGRVVYVDVSRSAVRDDQGRVLFTMTSVRDVTAERSLTEQLSYQALHDSLTGLPNRTLLMDRIAHAHQRHLRRGGINALILFDLDDFKSINDNYGHNVGDNVLVVFARRLEKAMRSSDTLCRLAGDEFIYLAEGLVDVADAELLAKRIIEVASTPFELDTASKLERSASAGIVIWDADSEQSAIELIQAADTAMYEAKRLGKARYVLYTPDIGQEAVTRFQLARDLLPALSNGELSMYYQPIVDLSNGEIVGWEALMRWQHPERGWVSPETFIPLAEQSESILTLGSFALRQGLATVASRAIEPTSGEQPYIAINLSARHFHDAGLIPLIEDALEEFNVAPQQLVIEITESVALYDIDSARQVLTTLDYLGIGFALDDFGTGYSSLSYLAKLHPKMIKIDRSFVSPATSEPYVQRSLEAILSLCQSLKIRAIAEGIETPVQLGALRDLGCEFGQGFLFSHAVPEALLGGMEGIVKQQWSDAITSERSTRAL